MRKNGALMVLASMALVGTVFATPTAVLDPSGPGLYANYSGTSVWQTNGWGTVVGGGGMDLIPGGGKAAPDADGGYIRYNTTLQPGGNPYPATPMSKLQDWVLSLEWTPKSGDHATIFELAGGTTAPYGNGDIAVLSNTGGTSYAIRGGDGSGYYSTAGTLTANVDTTYLLTLHYKASNQKFDFYQDNTLIASNFAARNTGFENLIFIQIFSGGTHRDQIDNVLVGLVPEPVSMVLLGVGSLVLGLRRKN